MRMFLPMNCESQKVACSLSIFVRVLSSLWGGDCRYGRYQLYLFDDMAVVRSKWGRRCGYEVAFARAGVACELSQPNYQSGVKHRTWRAA